MKAHHILILFLAVACSRTTEHTSLTTLRVEEFEKAIADAPEKIILDVRTPEEFATGHLPNATLINFHDVNFSAQVNALEKKQPVFVYCASGVRSDKAARILVDQGFTDVYVMEDGFNKWVELDKAITR